MVNKLELSPKQKPTALVIEGVLRGMGKTVETTIDVETRIVIVIEPSFTDAELDTLTDRLPAVFKANWNIKKYDLEETT